MLAKEFILGVIIFCFATAESTRTIFVKLSCISSVNFSLSCFISLQLKIMCSKLFSPNLHRLHFDCVALLERVVKDTRRVDHLPAQVLVVGVPCAQPPPCRQLCSASRFCQRHTRPRIEGTHRQRATSL